MWPRGALVFDGATDDVEDEDVTMTRCDLHGTEWKVTNVPRQGRSMADVIAAEWGMNKRKVVHKSKRSYVHCKCGKDPPCGMVVKYTLSGQSVRCESKCEHASSRSLREVVREVADLPSSAAASLGAWSQEDPEAAGSEMPTRSQVSRRKSLLRACQGENSIEEVRALVTHLQEREIEKEWHFEFTSSFWRRTWPRPSYAFPQGLT